ncbi:hypothetical protein TRFO_20404 [Tritrichomonas foetus]|uniref:Uncharacterized protein n=1 Tax=Tritrichomonas foetus TaxID=1144522 RepID=A0A1J4KKY4_9EUKA|nr:hypothetical protein TRFO_20404 [Tritrichomonas foetus]|eukprot:OHT10358.1 hypothetical protein TRFO_20404 [Tritrichomonas foetus]
MERTCSFRHVSFDQRIEQVGVSTNRGFIVFDCSNGVVLYEAKFPDGGANFISILSDSNVVACSGDDSNGGFMKSTVILWDKKEDKVTRLFDLEMDVIGVVLHADFLIAAYGDKISFYNACDFELYCNIKNPTCSLSSFAVVQSISANLVCYSSEEGDSLNISDYHDPNYILATIPFPSARISFTQFSRQGEMIAMVTDEGKTVYLYSLIPKIHLIATYHRGFRIAEVVGLSFDSLCNYFLLTTKRGTLHIFSIPTPSECQQITPTNTIRSKIAGDIAKFTEFTCQFDVAGYMITGITKSGVFKQLRLDVKKSVIVPIQEIDLQV